jgi:trans-aconitate 2-methyltransferase
MPTWDDVQYLKFADARTRPAAELLARVPEPERPIARAVDLGCGPGNSTELLVARWPQAQVVGVDSSAQMLARARTTLPAVAWVQADVSDYTPSEPPDVIFANAVLQWLPDHGTLVPRLFDLLAPGGALAIQIPYNFDEQIGRAHV